MNKSLESRMGLAEGLWLEYELACSKYHLQDCILAKVTFVRLLSRIKIKSMEMTLVRRETVGTGQTQQVDNVLVARYEVMDGEPCQGDMIPIRFYLGSSELTPTYRNVHNKFTVKYLLALVLTD